MKNEKMKYGMIGLLVGGFVVWILTLSSVNSNNFGMMRMMGLRSSNQGLMQNSQVLDAHFIEQMIPHHEDAITMSQLALQKAQKTEVKKLAQDIIESQSREINQMKKWYKAWYGKDVPEDQQIMGMHGMGSGSTLHMGMMGNETDITRLENVEDFDVAFVEEMIPHHQMAVMMASMLKNGTQRPEMKELADNIITAQTKEIDQMREWLNDWSK